MTTWPEDNISLYELYVRMDGIWVPDRLADAYCKKSLSKSEYKRWTSIYVHVIYF